MLNLYRKEGVTCHQPSFEGLQATCPSGNLSRDREGACSPGPTEGSVCATPRPRTLGAQKRRPSLAQLRDFIPLRRGKENPDQNLTQSLLVFRWRKCGQLSWRLSGPQFSHFGMRLTLPFFLYSSQVHI